MSIKAGQHMLAILPDRFGDDQRTRRIQLAEDRQPRFLRVDEPMLFRLVVRMASDYTPAFALQSSAQGGLHPGLLGPAFLIRRKTQIAIRDQINLFRLQPRGGPHGHIGRQTLPVRMNCSRFKVLDPAGRMRGLVEQLAFSPQR